MKRISTQIFLGLAVFLAGCVVIESPPAPRAWTPDETVIAEIDAAGRLQFDSARESALGEIASRSFLSPDAQVHLIKTAMDSLMFDSGKTGVLLKLIRNPYFVQEGKQAVLDQLNEFMFDSSRQAILEAIRQRGRIPSAAELTVLHRPQNRLPEQAPVETELTV